MSFPWTCPYCDRLTTINNTMETGEFRLSLASAVGSRKFDYLLIVCPNQECQQFSLTIKMFKSEKHTYAGGGHSFTDGRFLKEWRLVPESSARVFPEYVPQPIRADYVEACLIAALSPKASATLSRRCLQGMIRDRWNIVKPTLKQEVEALRDNIDPITWQAIEGIREIGNIGAHMEKDINLIVDVEPEEAEQLIWLIELLIKEWYIERHEREQNLKAVIALKDQKQAVKKSG